MKSSTSVSQTTCTRVAAPTQPRARAPAQLIHSIYTERMIARAQVACAPIIAATILPQFWPSFRARIECGCARTSGPGVPEHIHCIFVLIAELCVLRMFGGVDFSLIFICAQSVPEFLW
eukprot:COSAG02_NODE_36274_length_456_cov_6.056022_1_plen_118_part_01